MMLETLSSILGLSFVSGINLYAAVLTVGAGIRLGWLTGLPQELQVLANPIVLALAFAMYVAEFIADKVPFFTPIWDGIHTFIRPLGAAVLAMEAAGKLSPTAQVLAALAGGSIALGTHSTKAAARLIAHASPDAASHAAISMAEDFGVVALLVLAYTHPGIAVPLIVAMIVAVIVLLPVLLRVLRFTLRGIGGWVALLLGGDLRSKLPEWVRQMHGEGVRCYFRSGGRMRRLKEAYVVRNGNMWWVAEKKLLKAASEPVKVTSTAMTNGVLYDVLILRNGNAEQSFYLTKEWGAECRRVLVEPDPATIEVERLSLS